MQKTLRGYWDGALSAPLPVTLIASVVILATAYVFQYGLGYQPCDLCYYQRYPYMAVILIGLIGLLARKPLNLKAFPILVIISVLFAASASIAAFHVGVEQGWWEGPVTCSGGAFDQGSVEEVLAQIKAAAPIRCDEPAWTLFGISIAGYNILLAGGLFAFSLIAAQRSTSKSISEPDAR